MQELVRVSQHNYSLYSLVDRYKSDMLSFLDYKPFNKTNKSVTTETIRALLSGIPYKQVYCFERKMGGLFVLEKSCRLINLIKYVEDKFPIELSVDESEDDYYRYDIQSARLVFFSELPKRIQMRILRLSIPICLVEYSTEPGIQMRIASYVEDLSYTQEEQVRRAIYAGRGIEVLQDLIELELDKSIPLQMEADVITSLTYWYNFVYTPYHYGRRDFFAMENRMFDNLEMIGRYRIHLIVRALVIIRKGDSDRMGLGDLRVNLSEMKYKTVGISEGHLLGIAICLLGSVDFSINALVEEFNMLAYRFQDKEVTDMFRNCDKSNYGLLRFIHYLERVI